MTFWNKLPARPSFRGRAFGLLGSVFLATLMTSVIGCKNENSSQGRADVPATQNTEIVAWCRELLSDDFDRAMVASDLVVQAGAAACPTLRQMLLDQPPFGNTAILHALGRMKIPEANAVLMEFIEMNADDDLPAMTLDTVKRSRQGDQAAIRRVELSYARFIWIRSAGPAGLAKELKGGFSYPSTGKYELELYQSADELFAREHARTPKN